MTRRPGVGGDRLHEAGGRDPVPDGEAFRVFYDSSEYQAIVGKRLGATDGFAVLVDVPDR